MRTLYKMGKQGRCLYKRGEKGRQGNRDGGKAEMSSHSHALLHSNTRGKAWVHVCTVDQEDYISAKILVNTTVIGQTAHFFFKANKI